MFRKRLLFKLKTKLKKKKDNIITNCINFWEKSTWLGRNIKYGRSLNLFPLFFSKANLNLNLNFNKTNFDSNKNLVQELPSFSTLL